jgi:hypothetical protein
VLIEAKLYDRPSRAALGEQLAAQAGLLTHLGDRLQIPADGRAQLLLAPEQLTGELGLETGEPSPPGWPQVIVRTCRSYCRPTVRWRPPTGSRSWRLPSTATRSFETSGRRRAPTPGPWSLGAELLAG